MIWKRALTDQENEICRGLGEIVIVWNHVEQSFRILLHRATHIAGPDGRLWSLIAHLTPIQLAASMAALSHDHQDERRGHLIHCSKVFDREREYRNYYIHAPRTFWSTDTMSQLVASSLSARGGSLVLKQSQIEAGELSAYLERLSVLQSYIGELLQDSHNLRNGKPLSELSKPPVAPAVPAEKSDWWEHTRTQ